jgi:peptidoglycan/LPS O-acetylase OafA/YrhL
VLIPSALIYVILLASFVAYAFSYYVLDPDRRLTDRHFLGMVVSVGLMIFYIVYDRMSADDPDATASWIVFAVTLLLAAGAVYVNVRPQVPEEDRQL